MKPSIFLWTLFLSLGAASLQAQTPQVPARLEFVQMQLEIDAAARAAIQKDVDMLHRGAKFFQNMVQKADAHFELVEPLLAEAGVPNDFKYLLIQESSFQGNAVSSSQAVGYWQFKKEAAGELGLQISAEIDERMHLLAATKAACGYLLRSQAVFNNWAYSLISYNTGLGGARRSLDAQYYGKERLPINTHTHWYLRKAIAYKVAFQDYVGRNQPLPYRFVVHESSAKSLAQIAEESGIALEELRQHNHWLKGKQIPDDKPYSVLLPVVPDEWAALQARFGQGSPVLVVDSRNKKQKEKKSKRSKPEPQYFERINGVPVLLAQANESAEALAARAGLSTAQLFDYNDLPPGSSLAAGEKYFIARKQRKTDIAYHIANGQEDFRQISQQYGIRLSLLLQRNRSNKNEVLEKGRVVWLRHTRPRKVPIEIKDSIGERILSSPAPSSQD